MELVLLAHRLVLMLGVREVAILVAVAELSMEMSALMLEFELTFVSMVVITIQKYKNYLIVCLGQVPGDNWIKEYKVTTAKTGEI